MGIVSKYKIQGEQDGIASIDVISVGSGNGRGQPSPSFACRTATMADGESSRAASRDYFELKKNYLSLV